MSRCRECGARVTFSRTINGKLLPLDADPLPRPKVPREHCWRIRDDRVVIHDPDGTSPLVVISHFTVCPSKLKPETMARLWEEAPMLAGRAQTHGAGKMLH
jgi:hypothetical protein